MLRSSSSRCSRHLPVQLSRALTSSAADVFGTPPALPTHRVVVTGLGLVTPLGVGVPVTWSQLLLGACGVRALLAEDLPEVR